LLNLTQTDNVVTPLAGLDALKQRLSSGLFIRFPKPEHGTIYCCRKHTTYSAPFTIQDRTYTWKPLTTAMD